MSNGRALGDLEMIRLVAGREISVRMRAKSFFIGTAFLMVAILAVGVISRLATGDDPDTIRIGIVSEPRRSDRHLVGRDRRRSAA